MELEQIMFLILPGAGFLLIFMLIASIWYEYYRMPRLIALAQRVEMPDLILMKVLPKGKRFRKEYRVYATKDYVNFQIARGITFLGNGTGKTHAMAYLHSKLEGLKDEHYQVLRDPKQYWLYQRASKGAAMPTKYMDRREHLMYVYNLQTWHVPSEKIRNFLKFFFVGHGLTVFHRLRVPGTQLRLQMDTPRNVEIVAKL